MGIRFHDYQGPGFNHGWPCGINFNIRVIGLGLGSVRARCRARARARFLTFWSVYLVDPPCVLDNYYNYYFKRILVLHKQ